MTDSDEPKNPYVGPRAFRTGEKLHGRDRELNELVNLLIAERIILLHSPSGAGKSSLVNAGLLPLLGQDGFQALPVARVNQEPAEVTRSEDGVDQELVKTIRSVKGYNRYVFSVLTYWEESFPEKQRQTATQLAGMSLAEYLKTYLDRISSLEAVKVDPADEWLDDKKAMVLIFDQFEEILTLDPTDLDGKIEFFTQVGVALRDRSRWALFSIRDDYVASLDPYLRLVPTRLANTFRLDLLGVEAARLAISQPLEKLDVKFDDKAVEQLINDLRRVQVQRPDGSLVFQEGPYVEPVQLQVVCFRLWQTLKPGATKITLDDLKSTGDVDQSLRDYYSDRVAEAARTTGVPEREIRDWVSHQLITESGIRGQVLQGVRVTEGLSNEAIGVLVNAHVVRSENRRGLNWFELAHDRLLGPVKTSNEAWFQERLSLLQRQATLWQKNSRADHFQLRDKALDEAIKWAKAHPDELSQVDREFRDACLETRLREEEKLEAARQLAEAERRAAEEKLEAASKLAEAERLRAEEQAQSAKKLRVRFFMALLAALAAAVFAGMAFISGNQAREASDRNLELAKINQNLAEEAQFQSTIASGNAVIAEANAKLADAQAATAVAAEATAQAAKADALNQKATAEYNALLAIQQANLARSRELAGLANGYVENESDLALLLAMEAYNKSDTGGAMDALLRAVQRNLSRNLQRLDQRIPIQPISIYAMAASPDGRRLAWGGGGGLIRVWDFEVKDYWETFTEEGKDVTSLSFSPDGKFLVSGDVSAKIIFWDSIRGSKMRVIKPAMTSIKVLAFSPDGSKLAYGGEARGNEVNLFIKNLNNNLFMGFSIRPFKSAIQTLAWSPDGKLLATSGQDRIIRIWEAETGKELQKFENLDGNVNSLAFSPNGQTLASGGDDKTLPIDQNILLWDITLCNRPNDGLGIAPWDDPVCKQQTPKAFLGQVEDITTLAFSPDGQILATGDTKGTTRLWDVRYGELLDQQPDRAAGGISAVTFSQTVDALLLGVGSLDRTIGLSNLLSTDTLFDNTARVEGEVLAMVVTADDGLSLIASEDGKLTTWESTAGGDVKAGTVLAQQSTLAAINTGGDRAALLQSDGESGWIEIVTLADQGAVRIDAPQGENITGSEQPDGTTITKTVATSIDTVTSLTFSPDGTTLAGGVCLQRDTGLNFCLSSEIYFWDAQTGEIQDHYETGQTGDVLSLTYNPAGTILAAGGSDGAIYLRDVQKRRARGLPLVGLGGPVTSLAFTHDGRRLASGGANSLLALWDVDSAQQIANPLTGFETAVTTLVYSNDDQTLVAGGSTGLLAWWRLDTWFRLACKYSTRNLSQAEWEQFFKGEEYRQTCLEWPVGE